MELRVGLQLANEDGAAVVRALGAKHLQPQRLRGIPPAEIDLNLAELPHGEVGDCFRELPLFLF
jgi:hypothetical protein